VSCSERLNRAFGDEKLSEQELDSVSGGIMRPEVKTHCPTCGSAVRYVNGRPWCEGCQKTIG